MFLLLLLFFLYYIWIIIIACPCRGPPDLFACFRHVVIDRFQIVQKRRRHVCVFFDILSPPRIDSVCRFAIFFFILTISKMKLLAPAALDKYPGRWSGTRWGNSERICNQNNNNSNNDDNQTKRKKSIFQSFRCPAVDRSVGPLVIHSCTVYRRV
jgi:hypothetical protein